MAQPDTKRKKILSKSDCLDNPPTLPGTKRGTLRNKKLSSKKEDLSLQPVVTAKTSGTSKPKKFAKLSGEALDETKNGRNVVKTVKIVASLEERKDRKEREEKEKEMHMKQRSHISVYARNQNADEFVLKDDDVPAETAKMSPSSPAKSACSNKKGKCEKWAATVLCKDTKVVAKEFMKNKALQGENTEASIFKANVAKNRYGDIRCLDATRVILKERQPGDDYIHANWVKCDDGFRYICTQGPIEETCEDFWHMVWCEKCPVIVMLCNFAENGEDKCARYISTKKKLAFGLYSVQLKTKNKIEAIPDDVINFNTYTLSRAKEKEPQTVHHFHCAQWSDHLAPADPRPISLLVQKVRELSGLDGPVVVHCSAGIGRSGSFIVIDAALTKIPTNPEISMVTLLREVRNQRACAVQSILQYVFIHIVILDTFVMKGAIKKEEGFDAFLKNYRQTLKKMEGRIAKKNDDKEKEREKEREKEKEKEKEEKIKEAKSQQLE